MDFTFEVTVHVDHVSGKFAAREDLGDEIFDALDAADPESLDPNGDAEYDITDWSVQEVEKRK